MQGDGETVRTPDQPLVDVDGLVKLFPIAGNVFRKPSGFVHAVDGVSFRIERG